MMFQEFFFIIIIIFILLVIIMKQVEGTLLYMNMIYLKGNWLQIQENLSYGKKYKTKDEARHHENLTPIYTSGAGNNNN